MASEGEQQGEKRKPSPVLSMYQMLKDLCQNNAEHFRGDDTENGQRLHAGFLAIIDHVNTVTPLVEEIRSIAPYFDFDEKSPGNGYRSFVVVVDKCIQHGIKLCRQVIDGRDSFLFRKGTYMREVEACSHVLASLGTCMQHLKTLLAWSRMGELFPSGEHSSEELLKQAESINMYCFYGRCLGFQFCESMQTVLKTISICMASFSEIYYGNGGIFSKATNSVWTGGKYLLDPELRARRIVNISQHAQVDFCKSFWLLAESELMSRLPGMICPAVAVNIVIQIPPEPLEMATVDGGNIQVPIPSAHIGPGPVPVRLLCATRREGMVGKAKAGAISCAGSSSNGAGAGGSLPPPSPCLLLHVHGGGFVAQSSRSHETYLRDWAVRLGVPIISVDYSLAPRAPYPRALEEVFYAYCWALKNCRLLGSTAEQIILIGDSAGGNLNLAVTMKCIEMGIRQPSALFLAYVPVLVSFVPSPSRLLCLMDPLLPFGFMIRCLKAYACPTPHNSEAEESSTATDLTKDPVTSHSSTKNSLAMASSVSNNTLDNTLSLTAGGHKKKSSPNGHVPGSETESFEEVSESDLLELAAHKSPMSELGSDTLTTVSLASLQSRPEADLPLRLSDMALKTPDTVDGQGTSSGATPTVTDAAETPKAITQDEQSEKYVADFLEKYVLDTETDSEGRKIPVLREANEAVLGESDEHVLFELPPVDLGLSARLGRAAGNIASGVTSTFLYMTGQKSPSSERTPTNEPIGKRHAYLRFFTSKRSHCSNGKLSNGSDPPLEMSPKMSFKRFVEAGRIAFIVNGPKKGKLCTIVDVIDQTRVLVDGPLTGVERQAVRINQINLTKFCLKFPRGCRTATVRKAWKDAKIQEQWEKSSWAKSLVNKRKRLAMTDFDRFKLRKAVSVRNRIRSNEFFILRKFAYRKNALYGMKKAKKTEQMRESAKKKAIARAKARAVIKARWAAKGITAVFKRTLARPALFPPMQKKPSDKPAGKPTGKTPQKPKEKPAAKK